MTTIGIVLIVKDLGEALKEDCVLPGNYLLLN